MASLVRSTSVRCIIGLALIVALAASTVAVSPSPVAAGVAAPNGCRPGPTAAGQALSAAESDFVNRLNQLRRGRGLSSLRPNLAVSDQARQWSRSMGERNVLEHARTTNGAPLALDYVRLVSQVVPNWTSVGENVGRGGSVPQLHDAFVASSGHFANMIGDYNQVGVGVHVVGTTMWVTVRFVKGTLPSTTPASVAPATFAMAPSPDCLGSTAVAGDFDGNGVDDLFFYGPGAVPDGLQLRQTSGVARTIPLTINGTYRLSVGDFDGDGRDDVLFYAPGPASDYVWWAQGGGSFVSTTLAVNSTYTPLVGDFDGNGTDDLFWYAPGGATDYFWYFTGRSFRSVGVAVNATYQPSVADFDGNGTDDLLWYAPGSSVDHIWFTASNRTFTSRSWSVNMAYRPTTGDFDGDGRADIFWYAPGLATDHIWYFSGQSFQSIPRTVNQTYDVVAGDFDGSGVDDLFFQTDDASADVVWLFNAQRGGERSVVGSVTGAYRSVVGNFNGDGRDDLYLHWPGVHADLVLTGR